MNRIRTDTKESLNCSVSFRDPTLDPVQWSVPHSASAAAILKYSASQTDYYIVLLTTHRWTRRGEEGGSSAATHFHAPIFQHLFPKMNVIFMLGFLMRHAQKNVLLDSSVAFFFKGSRVGRQMPNFGMSSDI